MSDRKRNYKSGHQKRVDCEEKRQRESKVTSDIRRFISIDSGSQSSALPTVQVDEEDERGESGGMSPVESLDNDESSHPIDVGSTEKEFIPPAIPGDALEHDKIETTTIFKYENPNPTDKWLYSGCNLSTELKTSLVQFGACQPLGPFPLEGERRFSTSYYYCDQSMKSKRDWIAYSPIANLIYCHSCWLFANTGNPSFRDNWISGITHSTALSGQVRKHEASTIHIQAMLAMSDWRKCRTIDYVLSDTLQKEENFWRKVLKRIFNVILTLVRGNTALRGHSESLSDSAHQGNFLEIIKLVANYDPVLNELINDDKKKIKYLSPAIQNEMLEIMSSNLKLKLAAEARKSKYFTVILDSTQDITKVEQVSVILRYVTFEADKTIVVRESFVGFYDFRGQNAETYFNELLKVISDLQLDISNCRGQGYDGASVMSGAYSGLQTRISNLVPTAFYVHCAAHRLKLVLSDAACGSAVIKTFFDTIQQTFNYFGGSGPKWRELGLVKDGCKRTLKKVCPTRWESRHDAVYSLLGKFETVIKELTRIELTSSKSDERGQAQGIKKNCQNLSSSFR